MARFVLWLRHGDLSVAKFAGWIPRCCPNSPNTEHDTCINQRSWGPNQKISLCIWTCICTHTHIYIYIHIYIYTYIYTYIYIEREREREKEIRTVQLSTYIITSLYSFLDTSYDLHLYGWTSIIPPSLWTIRTQTSLQVRDPWRRHSTGHWAALRVTRGGSRYPLCLLLGYHGWLTWLALMKVGKYTLPILDATYPAP